MQKIKLILLLSFMMGIASAGCQDPFGNGVDWHGCVKNSRIPIATLNGTVTGVNLTGITSNSFFMTLSYATYLNFTDANITNGVLSYLFLTTRGVYSHNAFDEAKLRNFNFYYVTMNDSSFLGIDYNGGTVYSSMSYDNDIPSWTNNDFGPIVVDGVAAKSSILTDVLFSGQQAGSRNYQLKMASTRFECAKFSNILFHLAELINTNVKGVDTEDGLILDNTTYDVLDFGPSELCPDNTKNPLVGIIVMNSAGERVDFTERGVLDAEVYDKCETDDDCASDASVVSQNSIIATSKFNVTGSIAATGSEYKQSFLKGNISGSSTTFAASELKQNSKVMQAKSHGNISAILGDGDTVVDSEVNGSDVLLSRAILQN